MTNVQTVTEVLDTFCPMHLVLSKSGHIIHCGPTLAKLRDKSLIGRRFLEVFSLKSPRGMSSVQEMMSNKGVKLKLQFHDNPKTELKGVPMQGFQDGELVINLSFGISIVDGVRDYALTSADFAATDLTVEMLYLVEAKSAAMEASRKLNLRLQGAKIAAEEQAFTDTLTGLKNRRAMDHILNRYSQWETCFSVMQVDLDWFKAVNDTLGHAAGDHVLQTVARIMVEETRENDTVVRDGGDEFSIILPETHDTQILSRISERIITRLSTPIPYQGDTCRISASVGIALFDPDLDDIIETVLENADIALYASKHSGRAQTTFYEPSLRKSETFLTPPLGRAMPN
ncbi:MAG: GGDEF domain-containing protein [Paracoccaceae bacterium]